MAKNEKIPYFCRVVLQNFPFIEEDFDALTNYQLISKVVEYLNKVIKSQNTLVDNVNNLSSAFQQLKDYVEHYFDNLDVQEEINNKLDQMAEDGTLQEIITAYIQANVAWTFDTVADMKLAENFVDGSYAQTLGYRAKNDGGASLYKIRQITNDDVVNEGTIIELADDNLIAELIITGNSVSVKQFGAYGDDTHDDLDYFENAIAYIKGKAMNLYIPKGKYLLSDKLTVDWYNTNFWNEFNGSYGIKGDGIFQSILHFTSINGLDVNPENKIISIDLSDFSITNTTYNPLTDAGGVRVPNLNNGCGLKLTGIGYTCHVARIGVRGFYTGVATRNCYGGPILDNIFAEYTVFGYSSKYDTTLEHNSCNYCGYEACFCVESGPCMTLKNVICEGNVSVFRDGNDNNQRSKFEGRGFVFFGGRINMFGCYTEHLYGNARYIEDTKVIEENGVYNNGLQWELDNTASYADLKAWLLEHPEHNYNDYYVLITNAKSADGYVRVHGGDYSGTTANINVIDGNTGNTYVTYAKNVIFDGVKYSISADNTYAKFYNGNSKPVIVLATATLDPHTNYDFAPAEMLGTFSTLNYGATTNWNGRVSASFARKGSFSDNTYDKVELYMRHTLDGSIKIYRKTSLNGTSVSDVQVINIAPDGKVTFPQN